MGIVDDVIKEPLGGAHRDITVAAAQVEKYLLGALRDLKRFKTNNLLSKRYKRLRSMGRMA